MEYLLDYSNYTLLICEVINIFKSILSETQYNSTLEKWKKLAYESKNEINIRIYAACIPDNNQSSLEADISLFSRILNEKLRPTDLALALSIIRRGGFAVVPSLETIELLVINILLEGKDLHEVLPYVQRILATPSVICNQDQISELLINIPLHNANLSQPEILEISETFTRMYSIADENIDEESLFKILESLNHINLAKSVYSLLEYTYSQFETKRTKVQPIPEFGEKLINYVPNVKTEVMETKTFAYILG